MKVVGSIIARLGSKRLPYKNLLPFEGESLIGIGIKKLRNAKRVDEIVISTESELIARIAHSYGVRVIQRPLHLAEDNVPSIPVFQHLMKDYPGYMHVNFNINFPLCEPEVIDRAVEIALEKGESLSVPFAVWAQTPRCLENYPDPWDITAHRFEDERAGKIDVHTIEDLLECHRISQGNLENWQAACYEEKQTPVLG